MPNVHREAPVGPWKDLARALEEPLEGFEQRGEMIGLAFLKAHTSCCIMGRRLESKGGSKEIAQRPLQYPRSKAVVGGPSSVSLGCEGSREHSQQGALVGGMKIVSQEPGHQSFWPEQLRG